MILQLTLLFSGLITLAIAHSVAITFFLYWKYLWFDMPMHVLGGICVALGYSVLPFFRIRLPERWGTLFAYILVVFIVGVCWEIFEFETGITVFDETYMSDTLTDLSMDVIGAVIGYGILKSIKTFE